ncbi:MAG: hypothetical protein HYY17_14275 [Planctomycetes bacterium]|nr:hypothetical protein [Planctomycetota bacterium]
MSWESAAWKQADAEFHPQGIPYIRVYGTKGDLLGEIADGDLSKIEAAVRKEAR